MRGQGYCFQRLRRFCSREGVTKSIIKKIRSAYINYCSIIFFDFPGQQFTLFGLRSGCRKAKIYNCEITMEKICIAPQPLNDSADNNQAPLTSTGKGHIQWVCLKSGIQLFCMDYTPYRPTAMEYAPSKSLGFDFCLTGRSRVKAGRKKVEAMPGHAFFSYVPDVGGLTETLGTERVVRIGVLMDLEQFHSFTGEQKTSSAVLLENPSNMLRSEDRGTTAMRATIAQILNCPYQGAARSFFLESKVLELVAHKIGQIEAVDHHQQNIRPLPASDVERVQEAARLLTCDLENPPEMAVLAHSMGFSPRSLYRFFSKVYGIPPFDYLRNYRLTTAMELMQSGEANVTEAAFLVGYSSLSHFTKAFKAMFGVPPSDFLYHSRRQ